MKNQYPVLSRSQHSLSPQDISDQDTRPAIGAIAPPTITSEVKVSNFWQNRLIEIGMVLSMALYYVVGNPNLHLPLPGYALNTINPLYSLPFLVLFAVLSWYRFSFAIALLPLSFPYYYLPKVVYEKAAQGSPTTSSDVRFSMIEILLWTCVAIAGLRFVVGVRRWSYRSEWTFWKNRVGPFLLPISIFALAALLSIFVAYVPNGKVNAIRAFREEVVGPLLYLGLALLVLRSQTDMRRLIVALFSCGVIIGIIGTIQYIFFKNTITVDHNTDNTSLFRMILVYGSGNNLGLLLDYTLPIGLALLFSRLSWKVRLAAFLGCLPCFLVLYESRSRGSWAIAIPIVLIIVVGLMFRKRHLLLGYAALVVIGAIFVGMVFHNQIYDYVINGHADSKGYSTAEKRLYLWQSATAMIQDHFWSGVGMDNWTCYYSNGDKYHKNTACPTPNSMHHYIITIDPVTKKATHMNNEFMLSHPHNIFLHVWVSMGVFGFLAFVSIVVLFFWTFARLLLYLHKWRPPHYEELRWMLIGVGLAMLAAIIQGQMDSSFLEQDLSFCFWTLIIALLLLRSFSGMPWRALLPGSEKHALLEEESAAAQRV